MRIPESQSGPAQIWQKIRWAKKDFTLRPGFKGFCNVSLLGAQESTQLLKIGFYTDKNMKHIIGWKLQRRVCSEKLWIYTVNNMSGRSTHRKDVRVADLARLHTLPPASGHKTGIRASCHRLLHIKASFGAVTKTKHSSRSLLQNINNQQTQLSGDQIVSAHLWTSASNCWQPTCGRDYAKGGTLRTRKYELCWICKWRQISTCLKFLASFWYSLTQARGWS